MPEAGSYLRTRPKITSLRAESTLVNLLYGLPEAALSRTGILQVVFCGYMVNVRVSRTSATFFFSAADGNS